MKVTKYNTLFKSDAEEVQETSCRGLRGCPPVQKILQDWGIQGVD